MSKKRAPYSGILLYLSLSAVAALFTLMIYYYEDYTYVRLMERESANQIAFQEQMLETYISEVAGDSLFLSESPLIADYLRRPEEAELREALNLLLISKPRYRRIVYFNAEGEPVASVPDSPPRAAEMEPLALAKHQQLKLLNERDLLIELRGSGSSALWAEPLEDPRVDFWIPVVAGPSGEERFFLRISVDLESLRRILFPPNGADALEHFLLSSEGRVVALKGDGDSLPPAKVLQQYLGQDVAQGWTGDTLVSLRRFQFKGLNEIGVANIMSDVYTMLTVLPAEVRRTVGLERLFRHLAWLIFALFLLAPVTLIFENFRRHKEQAENKLMENIQLQSAILQTLPDSILRLNSRGDVVRIKFNQESWPLTLKSPFPGKVEELFPRDLAYKIGYYVNLVFDMDREYWFEYRLEEPRRESYFEFRFVPSGENEVILLLRNKTEEREQKRRLYTTTLFLDAYKSAMDASSLVAKTDRNGRLIYMNEHFRTRFGRSYSYAVGRDLIELMQPELKEEFDPGLPSLERLMVLSGIVKCRGGEEQVYYIDNTLLPIADEEGKVQEIISFGHDVTDLENALAAAREAENTRSAFIARMSHEMRTPLNCIIGFSEFVAQTGEAEMAKRYGRLILDESENLLDLVNQVLDLSKIEAGKLAIQPKPFDLIALLDSVVQGSRILAEKKGLNLALERQADIPRYFVGDVLRLRQVLNNLIGNAVKFTDRGEVQLKVGAEANEDGIYDFLFEIRDTGIGIPPAEQDRVFESFFQVDSGETRRYGGTGLGTTIARQLVELMGGEISFSSAPGKGSRFWFRLDLEKSLVLPEYQVEEPADESLSLDLRGKRILLVEDYQPNMEVLKLFLANTGAELIPAENGREAVDLFEGHHPDLILMDVHMPIMNGYKASAEIRTLEKGNGSERTTIIGVTANAFHRDIERCFDSGMDRVLIKPVRRRKLLNSLALAFALGVDEEADEREARDASFQVSALPMDEKALLEELGGDTEMREQLVDGFAQILEEQLDHLDRALSDEEWETLHREAHSIKGGAANLFADALSESALQLEQAAKERNRERADTLLPRLKMEAIRLLDYLKSQRISSR